MLKTNKTNKQTETISLLYIMIYTRDDVKHSGSFIPFLSCIFLADQHILEKRKDAFLKKTKTKGLFEI